RCIFLKECRLSRLNIQRPQRLELLPQRALGAIENVGFKKRTWVLLPGNYTTQRGPATHLRLYRFVHRRISTCPLFAVGLCDCCLCKFQLDCKVAGDYRPLLLCRHAHFQTLNRSMYCRKMQSAVDGLNDQWKPDME